MVTVRSAQKILIKKSESKRQLGKPRLRCESNIKVNFVEVPEYVDWIHLSQDRDQ